MQIPNTPYRTVFGCIRHIFDTEGIAAFYRSYRTTLLMNIPFQSIHFVTYEFGQSITNPQHIYNPTAHVISGKNINKNIIRFEHIMYILFII